MYSTKFEEGLAWAAQLHRAQRRKGRDTPYVGHLLGVASLVIEAGGSEEQAIAALLHDAVEDQGGAPTLALIRERFGDRVAAIVEGCTDTDTEPKPPWRARKEAYITHLRSAPSETLLVSAADKLHNARAILEDHERSGDAIFERFTGRREGTLWYYRALVEAYREAHITPATLVLVRQLEQVVATLEARAGKGPLR